VRTLEDIQYLTAWLGAPENNPLANEFDQMLDWQTVIDLGAFIHSAWVAEANTDNPDWKPWINRFDEALAVCKGLSLCRYGVQIARAKSIVLSEYLGDMGGAYTILDDAESAFGPGVVLSDQRVNLLGRSGDHPQVLEAWDSLIERFGRSAITDPFAYRRVAISAGSLGHFRRASKLFEAGAALLNDGTHLTRIGLLVDAAYCSLRANDRRRGCSLMAQAVLILPSEASLDGDQRWEAVIQVANAVGQLSSAQGILGAGGKAFEVAIGRASDTALAVNESIPDQAFRVDILRTQVAYLEAAWPDASRAAVDNALAYLDAEQPLLRLNACMAVIQRDATHGTSQAFLGYALKLAQTIADLKQLQSENEVLRASETIEDLLSGVLTLGILLVRSGPRDLLNSWMDEARPLNDAPLLAVLERLHTGMSLTTDAATREARAFGSRDVLVNRGAALQIFQSNEASARDVVIASLRIANALNSGLAIFFQGSLHPPVARLLASRLSLQLRNPSQFYMSPLFVPAIAQTIRQVIAGEAGIRELLTVGCNATRVKDEETLKRI
jgi:hypothetical protein